MNIKSFATILLLASSTMSLADTLTINFSYKNLDLKDASASFMMASSRKACLRAGLSQYGPWVAEREKEADLEIIDLGNNKAQVVVDYKQGHGFCKYKLRTVDIKFAEEVNGKSVRLHEAEIYVDKKPDMRVNFPAEILANPAEVVDMTCSKSETGKYYSCLTTIDGELVRRGMPASANIYEEALTGNDEVSLEFNFIR